jgi:hypothetical protein
MLHCLISIALQLWYLHSSARSLVGQREVPPSGIWKSKTGTNDPRHHRHPPTPTAPLPGQEGSRWPTGGRLRGPPNEGTPPCSKSGSDLAQFRKCPKSPTGHLPDCPNVPLRSRPTGSPPTRGKKPPGGVHEKRCTGTVR